MQLAARRFAGAHRRSAAARAGYRAAACRASSHAREHRRLLRRDLHQRAECRRDLPDARAVRRSAPTIRANRRRQFRPNLIKRLSRIQEAFIVAVLPPPVRGIGNAGGFRMMVEDRAGRGRRGAARVADRALMARAGQTPGIDAGVLAVRDVDAAGLSRHRPHQGAAARHQRAGRVQRAADLYRLGLRQRLQSVRPDLPRHRAGARRRPPRRRATC